MVVFASNGDDFFKKNELLDLNKIWLVLAEIAHGIYGGHRIGICAMELMEISSGLIDGVIH